VLPTFLSHEFEYDCILFSDLSVLILYHLSTGHGDLCTYNNHQVSDVCPQTESTLSEELHTGVSSLLDCENICSGFSSGSAECWAITYDSSGGKCTLFYL